MIFTKGGPDKDIKHLIDYAKDNDPIRLIHFHQISPIQAVYEIGIWWLRHSIDALHVTGADDPEIYREVCEGRHAHFRFTGGPGGLEAD